VNTVVATLYTIFFGTSINISGIGLVIFRTAFMYFYALCNVRLMDKRSTGLLSPFEIIILAILGDILGDPMYGDKPLFHAMVVITTIVFIERMISRATTHNAFVERVITGEPVLLVKHGIMRKKAMARQNISLHELYSLMRLHGVKDITEIEVAYLEPNGSISMIKRSANALGDSELKTTHS
jgi:uncharacterized membrane protein YcaP (DUF421 family)